MSKGYITIEGRTNKLKYCCEECNFITFSEQEMIAHLKGQHPGYGDLELAPAAEEPVVVEEPVAKEAPPLAGTQETSQGSPESDMEAPKSKKRRKVTETQEDSNG